MRVLLIEDSPDDIYLFQRRIKPGTELSIATTLEAGVRSVRETPPDIVMLDLNLPDSRGGAETYSSFSSQTASEHPFPVIVYTGTDDPEVSKECIELGAAAFIGKSQLADAGLPEIIEIAVERNRLALMRSSQEEITSIPVVDALKKITDKFKHLIADIKGQSG